MTNIDPILSDNQYFKEAHAKRQIVLHHTAGGPNGYNAIHGWAYNAERVATAYVICGKPDKTKTYEDGKILKAFDDQYWAYHLGLKSSSNMALNQGSIGIEICNWGQLIYKDGKYLTYVNSEVSEDEVAKVDYRGFKYYHKYTDAQIESVKRLLVYLTDHYIIPKSFHSDMFMLNSMALAGERGIWTHTSYRSDKNDCSPQDNLIHMLQSL
jgi:N-acetyl-anhydromuramyl-L-alanine amidase AmpD